MGIGLAGDLGSVFIEKEVTEGTYVPESEGASALEVLSDGLEFTPTKELLERDNRTSTVEKVPSRVGQKSMAAAIPTEFKAGNSEGEEPETNALYESLLGGKDVLAEVTTLTGHTTTTLNVTDSSQYKIGHIVKIKQSEIAGEDHVSPIASKSLGGGPFASYFVGPFTIAVEGTGMNVNSITMTADVAGPAGDTIFLSGDAVSTLAQLISNWNGLNPANTVSIVENGAQLEVPSLMQDFTFFGGTAQAGVAASKSVMAGEFNLFGGGTNNDVWTITADVANDEGNNIILYGNDMDSIDTLLNNWNMANPTNTATIDMGSMEIPDSMTILQLSGGQDEITAGSESITLKIPYGVAFSDSVKIGAAVNYYHKSGAPTLSVTNYLGGEIREKAIGMRCVTGEIANFATGQLPTASFSLEGLDFDRAVGQPLFTPVYDTSLPPVVLCSKVYKDATELVVNNVSISMNNTLGFLTSTASCSGKISSRITEFVTTFTVNPYMEDDDVDNFTLFSDNTPFSLFGSSYNKTATTGEEDEVVAFYMPNCRIPEISTGDEDGILTDAISGQAYKDAGNDTIFIAFL